MPCSSHTTSQNLLPIWLPHWPACSYKISREEAAWRREARGRKGRRGAEKRKKLRVAVWHGKQETQAARARVFRAGKLIGFITPTSQAVGSVQSTLGVGGCGREIYFYFFASTTRARCSLPRPAPRHCCNRRRTIRKMYSGADKIYLTLSVQW